MLPASDEAIEDFRWLREIVAAGGEATLARPSFLDGIDDEGCGRCSSARDAEYERSPRGARPGGGRGPGRECSACVAGSTR